MQGLWCAAWSRGTMACHVQHALIRFASKSGHKTPSRRRTGTGCHMGRAGRQRSEITCQNTHTALSTTLPPNYAFPVNTLNNYAPKESPV